jgi:6,7-dimethyl-8-ribityllumazine synthase
MNIIEGDFTISDDARVGIVVSRWNAFITERLVEGAVDTLARHGLPKEQIDIIYCPGSYELPLTALQASKAKSYDAILAIGCVIKGDTPHFDYVCQAVNKGIADLNLKLELPVLFGVLTTDTIQQAIERAGTKAGNKGAEVATAAIEMISLGKRLKG